MIETSNNFQSGRNSDISPRKLPNSQYISAYNVELTSDSAFGNLKNILGTTWRGNVQDSPLTEVIGFEKNTYKQGDSFFNGITIFTVIPDNLFKIFCFDLDSGTLYELYEEAIDSTYTTRIIDKVTYPEGGVDILYFSDNHNEPRYLKCEIPSPYSANFLSAYDLSLLRRGANGTISLDSLSGSVASPQGTLLSGTYQFCYRMADPENKRFTKWSSLTVPIHCYVPQTSLTQPSFAGVGLVTPRKITLTISPSEAETSFFDYVQLGVVENVGPTPNSTVSLLEIVAISGPSLTYDYTNNSRIGSVPLTDVTVDFSQIETAKTLAIKENRLFLGNLSYTDLQFDNGVPTITSGQVLAHSEPSFGGQADLFSEDDNASRYRGYWRDETYRFAIVYEDEYGNRSAAYPLDMSAITGNQISGGLKDMRFPSRSTSNAYSLFSSDGTIQSLGLRLDGITNHPSWARAFEIVRVSRKGRFKDILFQSPIVPMTRVTGIGAQGNYPQTYVSTAAGATTTNEDLKPQTAGTTLIPRNMFWPEMRSYDFNVDKIDYYHSGETMGHQFSMLFPSGSMYTNDGTAPADQFVFSGSEKIDFIDYALLRIGVVDQNPTNKTVAVKDGDDINTNLSANFYALFGSQYYFDPTWAAKTISSSQKNVPIIDYEFFSNFGQTTSVAGASVMDYASLQTEGLDWGYQPNIQKCAVVKLGGDVIPTIGANSSVQFAAATFNGFNPGGYVTSSNNIRYESTMTNNYVTEYSGYTTGVYVNTLAIGNVRLGLGDNRYGDFTSQHEFISTGCRYTFTESEVATLQGGGNVSINIDVFGGDCFVGPQWFKICDSTYSLVGKSSTPPTPNTATLSSKWKYFYTPTTGTALSLPVALEASAQYVQVVLESDYNGEVRDHDTVVNSSFSNGMPVYNNNTKESMRVPLTYKYNYNLNQENSQKIFVSKPEFSFEQNDYPARLAYSDIKLYNSPEAGFDIFRVANIFDLEEKYQAITKLAVAGDNLYAIQEQGINYIPTGERQIEQTSGGTLAVRSGDVIGRPLLIDGTRGSQHLRGIVETGSMIYIPDARNKSVYALSGQQLQSITKDNETLFRTVFDSVPQEQYVVGVYDPVKRQYWMINRNPFVATQYCEVFDEQRQFWVADYEMPQCAGGVYTNQKLYLIGTVSEASEGQYFCSIWSMYDGDPGRFFGFNKQARVTVSINPYPDFTKTFDDSMLSASERLSTIDFVVPNEATYGDQMATMSLDVPSYQNSFRIKNPRDSNGARLRGLYCLATINWKNSIQSEINSLNTKFRLSARTPW